jgi:Fe2+ transport system protein FeoA
MPIKPLNQLKPKDTGKIIRVECGGALRRRILDMGVIPGTEVKVERVAPLGNPIEIKIKGYHLSLRKEEAANIYVEVS